MWLAQADIHFKQMHSSWKNNTLLLVSEEECTVLGLLMLLHRQEWMSVKTVNSSDTMTRRGLF